MERLACEHLLRSLIDVDVGAAEAVDRLLRVAHEEKATGVGWSQRLVAPRPRGDVGPGGRQEHRDLDLQRIGVLELVDEDTLVSRPTRRTNVGIAEHVAREHEEVLEKQLTFVCPRRRPFEHRRRKRRNQQRDDLPTEADLQRLALVTRRLCHLRVRDLHVSLQNVDAVQVVCHLLRLAQMVSERTVVDRNLPQRVDVRGQVDGPQPDRMRRPDPTFVPGRQAVVALMKRRHDLAEVLRRHSQLDRSRDHVVERALGVEQHGGERSPPPLEVDRLADLVEHLEARWHADSQAVLGEHTPTANECSVEIGASPRVASARSDSVVLGRPLSSVRTRSRSSAAAFSVNVIAAT